MKKIFVTSDLHFSHSKIITAEERPFVDTDIMDKILIENWNRVVQKSDTTYVLGDFSFANKERTKQICHSLNGSKILIMGNHDRCRGISWWMDVGFNEVCRNPIIYNKFIIMQHEPPVHIVSEYIYLYAHVHRNIAYKTIEDNTACVCSCRWGFAPIEINSLLNIMNEVKNKQNKEE